jgi:hypothetical protein
MSSAVTACGASGFDFVCVRRWGLKIWGLTEHAAPVSRSPRGDASGEQAE